MLDKPIDEIVYENGKVVGVRSGTEVYKLIDKKSIVSEHVAINVLWFSRLPVLSVWLEIPAISQTKSRKLDR